MNRLLHDIVRLVLVVMLPLLFALASAMAQTVVYQNATTPLTVVEVTNQIYEWEIYSDLTVDFATVPGNCPVTSATFAGGNTGPSVNVTWLQPGIYFYKVTARDVARCAMNLKVGMIKVIPAGINAVIEGETHIGACQPAKLDGSKSIGENLKYQWSIIDQGGLLTHPTGVITEFQLLSSFNGILPADFRVKLQVTDPLGNTNSDTISINVDRLPIAEVYSSGKLEKDGTMIVDAVIKVGNALNYRWYTTEGKIVGPDNQATVTVFGAGIYTLEIVDYYGCITTKNFKFPIDLYQIIVNPDYARIFWTQDTTINVLGNDQSTVDFIPGTVRVIEQPTRGNAKVNANGTITYIPSEKGQGRDHFVYEVCNTADLCASATVTIDIFDMLNISQGLSPNGDGVNDVLIFGGLANYPESQLIIYNRSGQLVYQSKDYQNSWNGTTTKGATASQNLVPTGIYYYVLKLGGTNRTLKGYILVSY